MFTLCAANGKTTSHIRFDHPRTYALGPSYYLSIYSCLRSPLISSSYCSTCYPLMFSSAEALVGCYSKAASPGEVMEVAKMKLRNRVSVSSLCIIHSIQCVDEHGPYPKPWFKIACQFSELPH